MLDTDLSFVGLSEYLDAPPGQSLQESQSRIYVKFQPDGIEIPQLALLDCGAHYCILSREVVSVIEHRLTEPIGWRTFQTAFGRIRGQLYPYVITLIAEQGESLDVEVIAFICRDWRAPSYLGYTGVLDRIQWAVHPGTQRAINPTSAQPKRRS